MSYTFKGKTALVTGASRGIGKAILTALAEKGCNVIIHCFKNKIEAKKITKHLKELGINTSMYPADLTNEREARKMFQYISKKYKNLDILINNVGNYLKIDRKVNYSP